MTSLYKLPLLIAAPILGMALISCQSNSPTTTVGASATSSDPMRNTSKTPSNVDNANVNSTNNNNVSSNNSSGDNLDDSSDPKAPWNNPAIDISATDAIYYQEWMKSDNKSVCPILALPKQASSHLARHSVRRARFSGGWGVAYDLPNSRSMYGVANTGIINSDEAAYDWPYNIYYTDGSKVGYGHEGGNPTASWLAYVVTPNNCMYNVWSAQGKTHLEQMIADLRMVKVT